jgi:predicted nucleic acid-binding protein
LIFVDTSVWIAVLRSRTAPEAALLASLLDADRVVLAVPVRLELLLGAAAKDRAGLRSMLSALPIAYPTDDTWALMERWAGTAADRGQRFGAGDLLIAALAAEHNALVWSLDRDFERMERLKLVSLYDAPSGAIA